MRFLVDAMLPWRLAKVLRENGHEARHVRGLKPANLTDSEIWNIAASSHEVLITCDYDFLEMRKSTVGTKLIHYHNHNASRAKIVSDIVSRLPEIISKLEAGATFLEI